MGYAALVTRAGSEVKWEGIVVWGIEEFVVQGVMRPASIEREVYLFAVAPYSFLEEFEGMFSTAPVLSAIGDKEFFVGKNIMTGEYCDVESSFRCCPATVFLGFVERVID